MLDDLISVYNDILYKYYRYTIQPFEINPLILFIISQPWAAMDREKKARLASNIRDFWLPPAIPRRRFEDVTALELLGADKLKP
jgi:hypothetical protein